MMCQMYYIVLQFGTECERCEQRLSMIQQGISLHEQAHARTHKGGLGIVFADVIVLNVDQMATGVH